MIIASGLEIIINKTIDNEGITEARKFGILSKDRKKSRGSLGYHE